MVGLEAQENDNNNNKIPQVSMPFMCNVKLLKSVKQFVLHVTPFVFATTMNMLY